ncbi:MAG: acetylxylan esterase [Planctomycetota bacterium]
MPRERIISRKLSVPAYGDLGEDQKLRPIFPKGVEPTMDIWEKVRNDLRVQWDKVLGKPSFGDFDRTAEIIGAFEQPDYIGTIFRQPVAPDIRQLLVLMVPRKTPRSPRPGAVIPFYHPYLMCGYDAEKGEPQTERPLVQFGRHLVQQGYVVVCTEAFPYNTVPDPGTEEGFAWWKAAAKKLLADNPNWTGMGRLIWDTSRAVDLLLEQPDIDRDRILIIGHSLGGKMAFYTGCLDERGTAIIGSDFGIGWNFTNWDAPWYLGEQIHKPDFPLAHHHLLALHAPRSFLVIAGQADRPASWQYIQAAQQVYELYNKKDAVGCFDHGTGHQPTEESIRLAYQWLAEQFNLPDRPWDL